MSSPTPESLLELVCDRASFVDFVRALADEREKAAEIERSNPSRFQIDGAFNWKNADISSFLYASLYNLDEPRDGEPEPTPSWQLFAEILWTGKIID